MDDLDAGQFGRQGFAAGFARGRWLARGRCFNGSFHCRGIGALHFGFAAFFGIGFRFVEQIGLFGAVLFAVGAKALVEQQINLLLQDGLFSQYRGVFRLQLPKFRGKIDG